MRASLVLAALIALSACDPFPQVREKDTVEAYEAYLDEHPDSPYALEAKQRLETLLYQQAKAEKTLAAYDTYLERFPSGVYRNKAYKEREQFLWEWAERTHTVEGWEKYLKEYPQFEATKVRKARRRLEAAQYKDRIAIGEVRMEKANLAEDPEGPKNGWRFQADVTNNHDAPFEFLQLTIRYLDEAGEVKGTENWPVAATSFHMPLEPERREPLAPGETRTWELLTGDVPPAFAEKVELVATVARTPDAAPQVAEPEAE